MKKEWNKLKRDSSVAAGEIESILEEVCKRHGIRVFAQLHCSRVDEHGDLVQVAHDKFPEHHQYSVQIDIGAGF